jgi:hypothetical protein
MYGGTDVDRRSFLVGATAAVGGFTLLGQAAGCEPAPIAGQGYRLVFEDDFDTLNTDIWVPTASHMPTFPPDAATVADSVLTLRADQSRPRPYEALQTLGPIRPVSAGYPRYPQALAWQEGYFEVRARATKDPWTKLALWFFSLEDPNSFGLPRDCAVLNSEWDMVENGILAGDGPTGYADVNACSVVHKNTNSPCDVADAQRVQSVAKPEGGLCDWHVWSGKWTATEVSTYLDGQLLGTQPVYEDTFDQPMYFVISAAPTNATIPDNPPRPAFIETQVDWFRVWQK